MRYRMISALVVGAWLLSFVLRFWTVELVDLEHRSAYAVANAVGIAGLLAGLAMYGLANQKNIPDSTLDNIGWSFGLLTALLIELTTNALPIPPFPLRGTSWLVMWIVFFPLFVGLTPNRALLWAFAAATCTPLSFGLWDLFGTSLPSSEMLLLWSVGVYGAAIVVNVPVQMLHHQTRRARSASQQAARLGSYDLEFPLGEGGMGKVWRARHMMLARPAAIKIIRSTALGNNVGAIRTTHYLFEREARATAHLQSPHTVGLYDYGVARDGSAFYVMELLTGFDLKTLVDRFGATRPERTIYLLLQVCESLIEAHGRGLVHRDIKPSNIMVCRYALVWDFVKVLDFGMVKRYGDDETDPKKSGVQHFGGTPAFLAPELAHGSGGIGPAADIYGVGCVAYWLLCGRLVFPRRDPQDMIQAHLTDVPDPPSHHCAFPLPTDLEFLVLQCLAKDPADRPQSIVEVAERLRAVQLDNAWSVEKANAWWEENAPTFELLTPARPVPHSLQDTDTWIFQAR